MFTTTLRIPDDLAAFLQEAAQGASLSVNAFLAQLLQRERTETRRRRLAQDWTAYATEALDQDVDCAVAAQREVDQPARDPAPGQRPLRLP